MSARVVHANDRKYLKAEFSALRTHNETGRRKGCARFMRPPMQKDQA